MKINLGAFLFALSTLFAVATAQAAPSLVHNPTWLDYNHDLVQPSPMPGLRGGAPLGAASAVAGASVMFPTATDGSLLVYGAAGSAAYTVRTSVVCISKANVTSSALSVNAIDPSSHTPIAGGATQPGRSGIVIVCPAAGSSTITVDHIFGGKSVDLVASVPNAAPTYHTVTDAVVDQTKLFEVLPRNMSLTQRGVKTRVLNADGTITAVIEGTNEAWFGELHRLPAHLAEAYLTVVINLASDMLDEGGKLPGLSNTGQLPPPGKHSGTEFCVGAVDKHGNPDGGPAGWGGREATDCFWSARSGWQRHTAAGFEFGSYFYDNKHLDSNGIYQPVTGAAPTGKWIAYVERVKLNDVGHDNGVLGYWLCNPGEVCHAIMDKRDMRWRNSAAPNSEINELWINGFCGGRNCGPAPWPAAHMSLKRVTVTRGLPDLATLQAEVASMNGAAK